MRSYGMPLRRFGDGEGHVGKKKIRLECTATVFEMNDLNNTTQRRCNYFWEGEGEGHCYSKFDENMFKSSKPDAPE
jgi:hypothetical protein